MTRRRAAWLFAIALVFAPRAAGGLFDIASGAAFDGARLALPDGYVLLSPVCRLLDALSLLTLRQHLFLIGTALFASLILGWRSTSSDAWLPRALASLRGAAIALVALFALYAIDTVVPRPMAGLSLADPSLVAVDFHSHTAYSWDGRRSFDAEQNRRWHALAGFDVAYITDHRSVEGAREGAARNPHRAGDGVVLLTGLETIVDGAHICALGAATSAGPHVSILALPARLRDVPRQLVRDASLAAIELSDAAPRGLGFADTHHEALVALADSLHVAMVSGSDNHGWGRTAAAWSVMRIPGWRAMTPSELDVAIRTRLVALGPEAVRVASRTPVEAPGWSADLLGAPRAILAAPLELTRRERVSWLIWLALGLAVRELARFVARQRGARGARMPRASGAEPKLAT